MEKHREGFLRSETFRPWGEPRKRGIRACPLVVPRGAGNFVGLPTAPPGNRAGKLSIDGFLLTVVQTLWMFASAIRHVATLRATSGIGSSRGDPGLVGLEAGGRSIAPHLSPICHPPRLTLPAKMITLLPGCTCLSPSAS